MSEPKTTIRILIADDHPIVRQGYKLILRTIPDFELVGEAETGHEAVKLCEELQPDVVLMDVVMPSMDGITATLAIRQRNPKIQIVVLTSYSQNTTHVSAAMTAGAVGYLFKNAPVEDIERAIRQAAQGEYALSSDATRALVQARQLPEDDKPKLTPRELEVLNLMAEGMSNGEIAAKLVISESTVKYHVGNVLKKLDAGTRAEAVSIAHQHDLLGKSRK